MTDQTFRVISQPKLNFTVILNPDSGPGLSRYPGKNFVPQIQKLNSYSNVRTVGYVRTGFGTRNISSVLLDVSTYSGWATNASANANSTGLALQRIFGRGRRVPEYHQSSGEEFIRFAARQNGKQAYFGFIIFGKFCDTQSTLYLLHFHTTPTGPAAPQSSKSYPERKDMISRS
jgi:hypothetical protein